MNNVQFMIIVLLMTLSVQITRWLPFILFDRMERPPAIIGYLGKVLPAAIMGLLVVYCYKDFISDASALLPAVAAGAAVAAVHIWKRNTILSISIGTALYMVLIRISA